MSGAQAGPNQSFHDRLNRVAEVRAPIEDAKVQVDVLPNLRDRVSGKAGIIIAVLIGLVAVLLVRVVLFHTMGTAMIGDNADMILAIETGAALALSLVLFMMLPFKGFQYALAQFGGVVLMISMMHNAVHKAPGIFGAIFSPEWATEVTELTEPNSLFLRGEIIHFIPPEEEVEEEKKLPTVRRVG